MRLTQKLLGFLHRVFDKDPHKFLAFRLQYAGGMTWQVEDGFLYTTVVGDQSHNLTIDLSQYTVKQLVSYLAAQPGYSIPYADGSQNALLSARVLIDGASSILVSNGDHVYGYTNVLWSYIDAQANELEQAETQIGEMLKQMSTPTASAEWLDELGGYYNVPRLTGETDSSYGPRIIAEVLRPRSNNVALEAAISAYTGQPTTVSDVIEYGPTFPLYNGAIQRTGAYHYNASARPIYGLFDVGYAYDLLNGGDLTQFAQTVIGIIERYRAAGTHLRQLALLLNGSGLTDTLTAPTDGFSTIAVSSLFTDTLTTPTDNAFGMTATIGGFSDSLTAPTDAESITIAYAYKYNSVRYYNSQIYRLGGQTVTESL